MNNWKHYAGSVLLAGLLLQGCGSSDESTAPKTEVKNNSASTLEIHQKSQSIFKGATTEDKVTAENALELKLTVLAANDAEMQALVANLKEDGQTDAEIIAAIASEMVNGATSVSGSANRGSLLDKIKDGLEDIMNTDTI